MKLLCPMVKEKKHLQKYTLWPWPKVTPNVVQCPQNHMTFTPANFEIATSNSLGEDAFTRKYIIWPWPLNVAQCPLHHVTYAPTEFEITTSKALWGEAFTRNSIFDLWPWPWGQGHTKCCPVPSTSCDLFSYKV